MGNTAGQNGVFKCVPFKRMFLTSGVIKRKASVTLTFITIFQQLRLTHIFNRIGIRSKVTGPMVEDIAISGLLHCNESRPFWISWTVDSVRVGRGEILDEPLITWDSKDVHPILGLTVTTGSGNPAHWHFPQEGQSIVARY